MALENLKALEQKVGSLLTLVQRLKARNVELEEELRQSKNRFAKQAELGKQWDKERGNIRARIEKVMGELEVFEYVEEAGVSKEVALD